MNLAEMIVVIVLIGCVAWIANGAIRGGSNRSGARREELEEQAVRLEQLEERVRVLEAVVTDEREELRRKIDDL